MPLPLSVLLVVADALLIAAAAFFFRRRGARLLPFFLAVIAGAVTLWILASLVLAGALQS